MFECIILAGGFGTRLKAISGNIPKPMMVVGGEPFLYRLMKKLEKDGCSKIILALHYQSDYIVSRVNSDHPVKCEVCFSIEESPLGTGGAVKLAASYTSKERVVILNGDSYQEIDYGDFFIKSFSNDLLISSTREDNCERYGVLELDKDLNVISMCSKGHSGPGYINSGTYVIKTEDILSFKKDIFSFEADFIQYFDGIFKAYITNSEFIDIGIPEDFYKACAKF